ncbi:MAG: hypothetical protein MRERC_11c020 [Mycoplasmataceae bacterium RC_NB112A]|nr:MAG: hypothetical protein MRERC_11c020 [Mycoplasmataceae bacterium RC_NB112A]
MTIQEFGNAFKQAIVDSADANKNRQKAKVYPRNQAGDKAAGTKAILTPTYNYPNTPNDAGGSWVIDGWWATIEDHTLRINDDKGKNITNEVKFPTVKVRRDDNAHVGDKHVGVTIPQLTHGDVWQVTPLAVRDLTGVVENWTRAGAGRLTYAEAGYLCGMLFVHGWESLDVRGVYNPVGPYDIAIDRPRRNGIVPRTLQGIREALDNFCAHEEYETFFGNTATAPRNKVASSEIKQSWRTRNVLQNIDGANFIPAMARDMWNNMWEAEELYGPKGIGVGGGNQPFIYHPVTGVKIENWTEIEKAENLRKFELWDGGTATPVALTGFELKPRGKNATVTEMTAATVNAFLAKRVELIRAAGEGPGGHANAVRDDSLHAGMLKCFWRQGWNPEDLVWDATTNNVRVINPADGNNTANGFDEIRLLNGKWFCWYQGMAGAGAGPRGGAGLDMTNAGNLTIMDAWYNLTDRGTGAIGAANLTAIQARTLWNNNWEAADITDHNNDIRITVGAINFDGDMARNFGEKTLVQWRVAMATAAAHGSRKNVLDATGASAADNTIMDDWFNLTDRGTGAIGAANLTAIQARTLWNNNWEAADITDHNNDIRITVGAINFDGDMARNLGEKTLVQWRVAMATAAAHGSRKNVLDATGASAADNTIMDDWFNLTDRGTGHITAANLTAENARALYSNGWDANEIGNAGGEPTLTHPDGTSGVLRGYANINNLGNKVDLLKKIFKSKFKAVSGSSASATDTQIFEYYNKNLSPTEAAALYNGTPQVLGSELTKGTANDEVKYNGKDYKVNEANKIIGAKQAKIDGAKQAKIDAINNAISEIQTLMDDTSNNQPKVEDEEVKTKLGKNKGWKEYLQAAANTSAINTRKEEIKTAINEVRKSKIPTFDAATARTTAITAVKDYWKTKSRNQTENSLVNGKKIDEVLGSDWEKDFNSKNNQTDIDVKKNELIGKIDTEKSLEKTKDNDKIKEIKELFQNLFGADNEISDEVASSWNYNNNESELKNKQGIENLLNENVKGKEKQIAELFSEVGENPAGDNAQEKVKDFVTKQKSELVIKLIFRNKLGDKNYRQQIETEMENKMDDEGRKLDPTVYKKENEKYSKEAMIQYLYEKKTGQQHKLSATKKELTDDNKSHWDKYKWLYAGGGLIVLLIIGSAVVFWDQLTNLKEKNKET